MHPRLASLRLVAITGETPVSLDRIGALARSCPAGALLVQVRAKELEGGLLAELTRAVLRAVRAHGQLVLVNDRLDVALGAGADGVHLPEGGLSVEDALAIAAPAGLLVGCSRHSAAAVAQAARDGAQLIHLGPIWATPSKAEMGEPLGLAALAEARRAIDALAGAAADDASGVAGKASGAPCLVAVGGLDRSKVAEARAAGADAVAAIRAVWSGADGLL